MERKGLNHFEKLMSELRSDSDVANFIRENCVGEYKYFYEYLNAKLRSKGVSITQVMKASNINANYGYNIVNGARKNPSRDKVLAICIGSRFTFAETQEALDISGSARLYYQSERDVRLAAAINNKVGDVLKVNLELSDNGLTPLAV